MSSLFLAIILTAGAEPNLETNNPTGPSTESSIGSARAISLAELTPHQWREEIHAALKTQALATEDAKECATRNLVELFQAIGTAESLSDAEKQRLQRKLARRLLQARGAILASRKTSDPRDNPSDEANSATKPESVRLPRGTDPPPDSTDAVLAQRVGGGVQGAAGADKDYGEDLVELIENTIARDTWISNGGTGTIVYWRGLRVLVISNQAEVHNNVGGLLDGLRRAGQ